MVKKIQTLSEEDAKKLVKKYNQDIVCIFAWNSTSESDSVMQVVSSGKTPGLSANAEQGCIAIKKHFGWRNTKVSIRVAKKINKQLRQRCGIICCDCWHTKFTVSVNGDDCYVTCDKCERVYSVFSKKELSND